jgi:tRNA-modifying protein YgfZ
MHDNPQPALGHVFALPDHRILSLEGRDAVAFAQAQFMNDVKSLAPGEWQWNGWLTPKGRVIALFALLKLTEDTLWLLLPDIDPAELGPKLQRFVFRSKVTLAARDDLHAIGAFEAPTQASGARFAGTADSGYELDFGGEGGPRALRVAASAEAVADDAALTRWTVFDLAHGLPRLPPSQAEQWTPQMLSLDRLRGYSVKKGCYPGQEIVARTHFLGQVKRGLALFEADAPIAIGSEVRDDERALGTVISVGSHAGEHHALAVLPLEHEAATLSADGIALRKRPLLGGLAR